jgi:hypothetical protein
VNSLLLETRRLLRRDRVRPERWNWRCSETADISRVAADHFNGKEVALRRETDFQRVEGIAPRADLNFLLWRPRALAGPMGRVAGGWVRKKNFIFYRPAPRPRA